MSAGKRKPAFTRLQCLGAFLCFTFLLVFDYWMRFQINKIHIALVLFVPGALLSLAGIIDSEIASGLNPEIQVPKWKRTAAFSIALTESS
jgi:hypothetical protein